MPGIVAARSEVVQEERCHQKELADSLQVVSCPYLKSPKWPYGGLTQVKYFLILCGANLVENLDESVKLDGPNGG